MEAPLYVTNRGSTLMRGPRATCKLRVAEMTTPLLIIRLLLAAVFGLAAGGKLIDLSGTRRALVEFGVPRPAAPAGALVLVMSELLTAVLLVVTSTGRAGAILALALLASFATAIAMARLRGRAPDCHCFGAIHSAPAGGATLARIGVLAALAAFVLVRGPGRDLGDALAAPHVPLVLGAVGAGAVLLAQAALSWQLLRRHGVMIERIRALEERAESRPRPTRRGSGLPIGSPAPAFTLVDLDGSQRTLDDLLAPGRPVALAFSEPGCPACAELPATLSQLQADRAGELDVVLISRGSGRETVSLPGVDGLEHVLLQSEREVAELFNVASVPCAVTISPDGQVTSRLAVSIPAIVELLAEPGTRTSRPLLEVIA